MPKYFIRYCFYIILSVTLHRQPRFVAPKEIANGHPHSVGVCDLAHGIVICLIGQGRVQFDELLAQGARQHHFAVGCTTQQAVGSEVLVVVGVD